jgi:hypothetical protein
MKQWQRSWENLKEHYNATVEETGRDKVVAEKLRKSYGTLQHYSRGNRKRWRRGRKTKKILRNTTAEDKGRDERVAGKLWKS